MFDVYVTCWTSSKSTSCDRVGLARRMPSEPAQLAEFRVDGSGNGLLVALAALVVKYLNLGLMRGYCGEIAKNYHFLPDDDDDDFCFALQSPRLI